jgi:hypothetical protein
LPTYKGCETYGNYGVDVRKTYIRQAVEKTSAFRTYCPFAKIVPARFLNDAGIIGAVALADSAF